MRFASGQFSAGTDVAANLATVLRLMDEAAAGGADFLLLPELSLYGTRGPSTLLAPIAEPLDGPFVSAIADRAKSLALPLVIGTIEANPAGAPYNTLVAIDTTGALVGRYRKVHLYDAFGYAESDGITPGEIVEPFVIDLGSVAVGAFTCYDLRFPESARRVVDAGADVLLLPAMWIAGPGKADTWLTLVRARAIENTAYVVSANQTGPLATGHSIIVDPAGVVIAAAEGEPGVIFAEIEADRIAAVREQVPSLRNRRFRVVPG